MLLCNCCAAMFKDWHATAYGFLTSLPHVALCMFAAFRYYLLLCEWVKCQEVNHVCTGKGCI